ncbi:MAG: TrmH family RNA methyltransferase [Pseudomonadota bacterium]
MPRLVLYQPEIAANLGAAIRIAACLDTPLEVVEPCGFPWRAKDIDRVALDYRAELTRHADFEAFRAQTPGRLVLLTTKAAVPYTSLAYRADDLLLIGQESAGVPEHFHALADHRVVIPMAPSARSLNLTVAAAIVLSEALRQLQVSSGIN